MIGRKLEDGTFEKGSSDNGLCYKDQEAFKNKRGVCYIPEYWDAKEYSYMDIKDACIAEMKKRGVEGTDSEIHNLAKNVFNGVDWQLPETILDEERYLKELMEK